MSEALKGKSQKSNHSGRPHPTAKNERGRVRNKPAFSHTVNPERLSALLTVKSRLLTHQHDPTGNPPPDGPNRS